MLTWSFLGTGGHLGKFLRLCDWCCYDCSNVHSNIHPGTSSRSTSGFFREASMIESDVKHRIYQIVDRPDDLKYAIQCTSTPERGKLFKPGGRKVFH